MDLYHGNVFPSTWASPRSSVGLGSSLGGSSSSTSYATPSPMLATTDHLDIDPYVMSYPEYSNYSDSDEQSLWCQSPPSLWQGVGQKDLDAGDFSLSLQLTGPPAVATSSYPLDSVPWD